MNVHAALQDAAAPADGEAAGARAGMRQAWLKSLEQAWREHSRSPAHAGNADRQAPQALPAQEAARHAMVPELEAGGAAERLVGAAARAASVPAEPQLQVLRPVPFGAVARQSDAPPSISVDPLARPDIVTREVPAACVLREAQIQELARRQAAPASLDLLPQRRVATLPEAGGLAVWIRDSGLAETDARRLADGLRRTAREAGVNLRRVAVNGRTVYESHEAPPAHEAHNHSTRARS